MKKISYYFIVIVLLFNSCSDQLEVSDKYVVNRNDLTFIYEGVEYNEKNSELSLILESLTESGVSFFDVSSSRVFLFDDQSAFNSFMIASYPEVAKLALSGKKFQDYRFGAMKGKIATDWSDFTIIFASKLCNQSGAMLGTTGPDIEQNGQVAHIPNALGFAANSFSFDIPTGGSILLEIFSASNFNTLNGHQAYIYATDNDCQDSYYPSAPWYERYSGTWSCKWTLSM